MKSVQERNVAVNPQKSTGNKVTVAVGVIAVAVLICSIFLWRNRGPSSGMPKQGFFTTDDGKTFFEDSAAKIPPFDRDGKPAYGCYIFTDDNGQTKYVGWLYRYTDEGKQRLDQSHTSAGELGSSLFSCIEVKAPGTGDSGWVPCTNPLASRIQNLRLIGHPNGLRVTPE
jgi:hypothetical protein